MRRIQILIAMIAALLIVVPAALAQVKPPQTAPVPNVVSMPLNAAQQALVSAGFNALVTQENVADPGKNNIVLKQQIPPGTTLAKGSNVPVVVGKYTAPAQQPVPNVVGLPLDKAQAALSQAKLNAAVTMQPVDQPQRNNVVLTQQIDSGKTLPPGSTVPIVVGKYTAPAQQPVPNVVGMKLGEAQAALVKAKLNAAVTLQPVDQPQSNDVVLTQQIPSGKTLPPGSTVPIIVGKYTAPAQQPVPNVVGMKLAEAQAALVKAKLNAGVTMQPVDQPQRDQVVLTQQIAAGKTLPPGSTVPIVVGKYTAPTVPNVVGMKLGEAQAALAKAKLNAAVTMQPVDQPQRDQVVLTQQIASGKALPPGSTVPIVVGKYTAPTVPNVVGMKLGEAQAALSKVKLNAVVTMEKVTDKNKNGIVLKQQIATGSALAPGAQVPLIVGQYQEPVRVPSIVGMTEKQAETALKQANLKINSGARTVRDQRQVGTVLDQNPAPGTAVEPGSQVVFTVGLDPKAKIVLPPKNPYYPYNPPIEPDSKNK